MSNVPQMAEIAALVGDPARANILCALLVGRALTATELALAAGVTPQTASGHLGRLLAARLLVLMKQGRHRYYRLAGPQVAQMLESIMTVALAAPPDQESTGSGGYRGNRVLDRVDAAAGVRRSSTAYRGAGI